MPKTHVSKSIFINASVEKIHDSVVDFHQWQKWSPWLICEPEANVEIASDGMSYHWEGKRVGAGKMKISHDTPTKVEYDLTFLKPWRSKAKVSFILKEEEDGTQVKWTMDSSLPFFLFWMKKSMQTYIGMDYERGLRMLKDVVETGSVPSKLSFEGIKVLPSCQFVGVKNKGQFEQLGALMEKDFTTLYSWAEEQKIAIQGNPFSQYHKFDLVKNWVEYSAAIPVSNLPTDLPTDFYIGQLPDIKVNVVKLKGAYDYLGNAWSANMMMARNKEFKQNKKIHPLEIYHNDPAVTAPHELITEVCIPVKQ